MPKKKTKTKPTKKPAKQLPKLSNAFKLSQKTWEVLRDNYKLFLSITVIYGLLSLLLVQGLSGLSDVSSLKNQLNQGLNGHLNSVSSSLNVFAVLLGSASSGSTQTSGTYQIILGLITSLVIIYSLRHVYSGAKIRLLDAYYKAMYPLIPFILVLLLVCVQLIPFIFGAALYSTVITNAIAVNFFEKLVFLVIFIVLAIITLYFLSSSLIALYIVTLEDMTPRKALRSAKELVKGRRLSVIRKIIYLPIVLLIIAGVLMLPFILWLSAIAAWVFFVLTMLSLSVIHAYMYTLYRELLNE